METPDTVLRAVTENYFKRSGVDIKLDHGVDNLAMAISLVASTRGLSLMPYARNLLPSSVVSRSLEGNVPTIDLAIGYSKANIRKRHLAHGRRHPPRPVAPRRCWNWN